MLDPKLLREQSDLVSLAFERRGTSLEGLAAWRDLDQAWRKVINEVDALKAEQNRASKEIAERKRTKQSAEDLFQAMKLKAERAKELTHEASEMELKLRALALTFPNLPDESVPVGRGADENQEVRCWGEPTAFSFQPKPHWELGVQLGLLDFEQGAKLSGSRYAVYHGAGARLERALIQLMLDLHIQQHGYKEVMTPVIVNDEALMGTGQLPKFAEDLFRLEAGGYLIPTAEVTLTNLHAQSILEGEKLPLRYVAHTLCFRREAGSYGKDVRGLIRQHQFNKVELVTFTQPEKSMTALEMLTSHAEAVLRELKLPYRVMALCTGDLGFGSAKTYDLEVWFPSEGKYREISSCSNFKDFQARRANIRYRPEPKEKPQFVHTLNGSGLAVGRTFAAILENYQQPDGSVVVPEVLRPLLGCDRLNLS